MKVIFLQKCFIKSVAQIFLNKPSVKILKSWNWESPATWLTLLFGVVAEIVIPLFQLAQIVISAGGNLWRNKITDSTMVEAKDTKRIQGQGQTLSRPRTGMLETKDTKRKCSPKKSLHKNFSSDLHKKNVFQKIFQALHKILTIQKIVLSSSRGQANFRGLEAKDLTFEAKAMYFKMCPRGLHLW